MWEQYILYKYTKRNPPYHCRLYSVFGFPKKPFKMYLIAFLLFWFYWLLTLLFLHKYYYLYKKNPFSSCQKSPYQSIWWLFCCLDFIDFLTLLFFHKFHYLYTKMKSLFISVSTVIINLLSCPFWVICVNEFVGIIWSFC